jgi:hypothetical protein
MKVKLWISIASCATVLILSIVMAGCSSQASTDNHTLVVNVPQTQASSPWPSINPRYSVQYLPNGQGMDGESLQEVAMTPSTPQTIVANTNVKYTIDILYNAPNAVEESNLSASVDGVSELSSPKDYGNGDQEGGANFQTLQSGTPEYISGFNSGVRAIPVHDGSTISFAFRNDRGAVGNASSYAVLLRDTSGNILCYDQDEWFIDYTRTYIVYNGYLM